MYYCSLRRNADELKKALEDVVIPMFCTAALNVNDDQQQKLQKVFCLMLCFQTLYGSGIDLISRFSVN